MVYYVEIDLAALLGECYKIQLLTDVIEDVWLQL